jgi:DUF1680 family protein
MFLVHGDAKYLDVLERALYNAVLSSVSLSGNQFFYANPLEHDGQSKFNMGTAKREPWLGSACCPTFVVRFMPRVGDLLYASRADCLYVNLFVAGAGRTAVQGNVVRVKQQTEYPWDGAVEITVEPDQAEQFALCLRIPGWARDRPVPSDLYHYLNPSGQQATLKLNGEPITPNTDKGFVRIHRKWEKGDTIALNLPMPIRRVVSHEAVEANAGRVALERGPIVYCVESPDNGGQALNLWLPDATDLVSQHCPDLLGGVTVLRGQAMASHRNQDESVTTKAVELTAIPYYAWANRGPSEMAVWLPRRQ